MKKKILTMIVWLVFTLVSTSTHAQLAGSDYGGSSARVVQGVEGGVIVDVLVSSVHTDAPVVARVAGSALVGAGCSRLTAQWSSWAARAGVIAACAAGGERPGATLGRGVIAAKTLIVKLDSGRTLAVMQADEGFQKDERVWVLSGQGTRVMHAGL